MNMNKEFIPYEQALELKELGFNEYCFKTSWDFDITDKVNVGLPLYQQAFRWFRENHGLYGIQREWTLDKFSYEIKSNREGSMTFEVYGGYPLIFKTYEEAELACLNRLIEIVKNK